MNRSEMNLGQLVKAGAGQPYQLTLDLTQVITEMPFSIAGRVIAIWAAPTAAENIFIRFNKRDAAPIQFTRGKVLCVPFTKIYITVPAGQAGNMVILYGPDAFEVLRIYPNPTEYLDLATMLIRLTEILAEEIARGLVDDNMLTMLTSILLDLNEFNGIAQPAIIITNVAADANTVGTDHACKAVLIRALTTNTGLVWVNFQAAAVDGTSHELDAGDAITVKLTNTNLINCLFKVANESVSVIYQV